MGGMAAQVPIKNDPAANEQALEKVRQDKLREVRAGHDGTWVAHPGLVSVAKDIFDEHMRESRIKSRASARMFTSPQKICWLFQMVKLRSRVFVGTSMWVCSTWMHGCVESAACPSTT